MSDRQSLSDQEREPGARSQPPLLDRTYLDACLQGGVSPKKLSQMADLFEARLKEDWLAMLEALAAGDLDRVGACAHRLKGSSGSLGLVGVRSHAAGIEEAVKTRQTTTCRSALDALPEVSAASLRAFRDHLGIQGLP